MLNFILEEGKKRRDMLGGVSEKADQTICLVCLCTFLVIGLVGLSPELFSTINLSGTFHY